MVDLEGQTVLPGLNDPHVHFAHTLGFEENEWATRLRSEKSIEEMLTLVQEKIDQTPAGELVWFFLGAGSPNALEEGPYPNRRDLDPICVANGVCYPSLGDGSLEVLDAETGKLLWQSSIPSTSRGGIVIANGNLYTSNGEGGLPTEPKHRYYVYAYSIDGR